MTDETNEQKAQSTTTPTTGVRRRPRIASQEDRVAYAVAAAIIETLPVEDNAGAPSTATKKGGCEMSATGNGSQKPARHTGGMNDNSHPDPIVINRLIRAVIEHGVRAARYAYDETIDTVDNDNTIDPDDYDNAELRDVGLDRDRAAYDDYFSCHFAHEIVAHLRTRGDVGKHVRVAVREVLEKVIPLTAPDSPNGTFDPHGVAICVIGNLAGMVPDDVHKVVARIYDDMHPAADITCTLAGIAEETKLSEEAALVALNAAVKARFLGEWIDESDDHRTRHYYPAFRWWRIPHGRDTK